MDSSTPDRDDTFYAALLSAFVNSRMERDKSLLALASGGIGLTVSLISLLDTEALLLQICFALMLIGFMGTIYSALAIFKINAMYVKGTIKIINEGIQDQRYIRVRNRIRRRLECLDNFSSWFFGIAVFAAVVLGISTTFFQ